MVAHTYEKRHHQLLLRVGLSDWESMLGTLKKIIRQGADGWIASQEKPKPEEAIGNPPTVLLRVYVEPKKLQDFLNRLDAAISPKEKRDVDDWDKWDWSP